MHLRLWNRKKTRKSEKKAPNRYLNGRFGIPIFDRNTIRVGKWEINNINIRKKDSQADKPGCQMQGIE
jgi:hypothetical protein